LGDYVPSPQSRLAIDPLLELSVGVDLLRRGHWVGESPHTYFYVNYRVNAPNILEEWSNLTRFTVSGAEGSVE
jgi:hypothetical protein